MKNKILKTLGMVFVIGLIISTMNKPVSAKASAIDIVDSNGKLYEYNYDALKQSATSYALKNTNSSKLYNDFLSRKSSIKSFYDDIRNVYVSYDTISNAAINATMNKTTFNFNNFIESNSTPTISVTPIKVNLDSSGNVTTDNGQSTDVDPGVDLNTLVLDTKTMPYSTLMTFKLNVSDPQDYTVTVKGQKATYNSANKVFGVAITGIFSNSNFSASDFALTKISSNTTATISKIDNVAATVNQGESYILPTTVSATMSDGSIQTVNVTWDKSVDTSTVGTYTFNGTVSGYNNKVILTLIVEGRTNDWDNDVDLNNFYNNIDSHDVLILKNVIKQFSPDEIEIGVNESITLIKYSKENNCNIKIDVVGIRTSSLSSMYVSTHNFEYLNNDKVNSLINLLSNLFKYNDRDNVKEHYFDMLNNSKLIYNTYGSDINRAVKNKETKNFYESGDSTRSTFYQSYNVKDGVVDDVIFILRKI